MHFDTVDTTTTTTTTPTAESQPAAEATVKITLTKRTILTVKEKYEICQFKDAHTNYSHQNVADHFTALWGKKISRRVIGDIIADRHKWTDECEEANIRNVKRFKGGKHEELEDLLELWVSEVNNSDGNLTDSAITEQAKIFGQKLGISDFQYSSGWLHRFKRRRGLLSRTPATATRTKINTENNISATKPISPDDNSFFNEAVTTLNNISGTLFNTYNINTSSGAVIKLQTISIAKVDEANNYQLEDLIQLKKESSNDSTFEEFFRKPEHREQVLQDEVSVQEMDQEVSVSNHDQLIDDSDIITTDEAKFSLLKLKTFFNRKSLKSELIMTKLDEIEEELNTFL